MASRPATSSARPTNVQRMVALRAIAIVCLVGFVQISARPSASARTQAESSVGLGALVCDHDPGNFGGRDERIPDGCRWQGGVRLDLATSDGRPLGSCTTPADGRMCRFPARFDSVVILRQDTETVPAGYVPKQNPVLRLVTANGMWIVNVPQDQIPVPPADAATLTIHSRFCPPGFAGPDYFTVCHATRPIYTQSFFLANCDQPGRDLHAGMTDAEGDLTLSGIAPATYRIDQGLPENVVRLWVYCSRDWNPDDRVPADVVPWWDSIDPQGMYTTSLTLEPNANILCDFYAIPSGSANG
jgi:hypothetical protein